jgi:capsular exopolysaccharide synthesis family protein
MKNLERLAAGPINEQIEYMIERDPIMISLAQQLVFQKSELAAKLTKFGENHRVVRQIQEFIKEIEQRRELRKLEIAEQTRLSNLQNAQDQLIVLSQRLEELNKLQAEAQARKKDLDLARIQYEQRTSIRDERKNMLNSIKTQIEKLKIIHDDPQTPKVQFVGFAPIPFDVSSPRLTAYLPGGTMLGLMLGIGLALLIELLNDLVRTPRDVGRHLHIKLLGMIPDISEDGQTNGLDPANIVIQAPYSILSESYRRLRTNLKLSTAADSSKVLLISSPMTADGKTSVAVNLAATFIAENKKVLLVDANLKRPGFAKIFSNGQPDAENDTNVFDKGLSSLLAGQAYAQEVIKANVVESLDIIYAGPMPSNPSELLGSDRMKEFIRNQQDKYDYIIIDGPPALLVSDTKVLTRIADATVLVFNAGTTRRGVALRTIRELREVDTKIIGCVLLAVKSMKGGYFREQFKSYREYQELQLAQTR